MLLRCFLIHTELLRSKVYALKHSRHGLVETTRVINLQNPYGPFLGSISYHHANSCHFVVFSATGAVCFVHLTLHSGTCQIFSYDQTRSKPTRLESLKIPGRYHTNITPCMSITMHGAEAVASSSGLYCRFSLASLSSDAFVPGFGGFFSNLAT